MQEMQVRSPGWEELLEKEMATHSSILAWEVLWKEESGGLQSIGSQRVRHNLVTRPPPFCVADNWLTTHNESFLSHVQKFRQSPSPPCKLSCFTQGDLLFLNLFISDNALQFMKVILNLDGCFQGHPQAWDQFLSIIFFLDIYKSIRQKWYMSWPLKYSPSLKLSY